MFLKNVAAGLVKKYKLVHPFMADRPDIRNLLEADDGQFNSERFEIIFHEDIAFRQ